MSRDKQENKPKVKDKNFTLDKMRQDVIMGLVKLGMSKPEAVDYVKSNDFATEEEYFLNLPKRS